MDIKDRQQLRRTLKWALRTDPYRRTESKDGPKRWHDKQTECLLVYGMVKKELPARTLKIIQWHFEKGLPLDKIAFELNLSTRQIIRDINKGLDLIIDSLPEGIAVSLSPQLYTWLLRGCPHCGGDLYWDALGAHDQDGEYCCAQCGHRYSITDIENKSIST
jgi:hypothetical protein